MPPSPRLRTLADRFLVHVEIRRKASTAQTYRVHLEHFCRVLGGDTPLLKLTNDVIDRFILAEKKRGLSAGGINAELRVLKAALRWAAHPQRGRMIPAVPCLIEPLRVTQKIREKALGLAEVEQLLAVAGVRDRALLLVLACTGMRIDEALHLKWEDFRDEAIRITSKDECDWSPKGHAERICYLTPRVIAELESYRATLRRRAEGDWMFQSKAKAGRRLTTLAKVGRAIFERAGVYQRGKVFHELRRAAATAMNANGVGIESIRDRLGHREITTTQLYFRQNEEAQREAARRGLV